MRKRGAQAQIRAFESLLFYLMVAAGIGAVVGLWIVGGSR